MKLFFILILIFILIIELSFYNVPVENFENISEDIGNYLASYFYKYTLSVLNQTDFNYTVNSNSDIIKYLPQNIPYNSTLYSQLKEKNITIERLNSIRQVALWVCDAQWKITLLEILKPTVHQILDDCLQKSGLKSTIDSPIIHFRCADTPFIKYENYYFQKYKFFKVALEKVNSKNVILMSYTKHHSDDDKQNACKEYTYKLKDYLTELGYNTTIQTKTNVEDFADLFYAPAVISTGGSFSFMSGFFGNGIFISSEHVGKKFNFNIKHDQFINGYNIEHSQVESYYDIDKVYTLLTSE